MWYKKSKYQQDNLISNHYFMVIILTETDGEILSNDSLLDKIFVGFIHGIHCLRILQPASHVLHVHSVRNVYTISYDGRGVSSFLKWGAALYSAKKQLPPLPPSLLTPQMRQVVLVISLCTSPDSVFF